MVIVWYNATMILGISGKTLTHKLGIKQGDIVSLINAPEDYGSLLFPIPPDCSIYDALIEPADFIQFFTNDKDGLKDIFPKLTSKLKPDGTLWISWPKKTSNVKSDLEENSIREIGLENGLVDVNVIEIDETWSGLKFVYG
jgi:hypothetical protein